MRVLDAPVSLVTRRVVVLAAATPLALLLATHASPADAADPDFERVDAAPVIPEVSGVASAVIDPGGEYAYFGGSGHVVKFDLATSERVDTLRVGVSENGLRSAVIDPDGEFAYFGTNTTPGRVVKIDLATFERVDGLALASGEDRLHSAVIDPAGDFAYFATSTSPGQVVKVDLTTFDRVGVIVLDEGQGSLTSAAIDPAGEFAYFGTSTSPGQVVKVALETFEQVDAVTLESGEDDLRSAVVDAAGSFGYFGTSTSPGRIVKVDLATFERVDGLALASGEDRLHSAVIDPAGDFAYFGTSTSPGRIVKVDLASFDRTHGIVLAEDETRLSSASITPDGAFAFVTSPGSASLTSSASPSRVVRVDLAAFERADAAAFGGSQGLPLVAAMDPDGEFGLFWTSSYRLGKFDLATFEHVDTLDLEGIGLGFETTTRRLQSMAIDPAGDFAYVTASGAKFDTGFGTFIAPGVVAKIDLNTFEHVDTLVLDDHEIRPSVIVIDRAGDFAYVATLDSTPRLVMIDLETFERVAARPLDSGVQAAVIDPQGEFAYLGTLTSPAQVLKIRLATLGTVGAVSLQAAGSDLRSPVIDPAGGFLYFGIRGFPGRLAQIDLSAFEHVGTLPLEEGENEPSTLLMDRNGTFLYFATLTSAAPADVVQISPDTLERVDAITLESGEDQVRSAVTDPDGVFAYVAAQGQIVRVSLGDAGPAPELTVDDAVVAGDEGSTVVNEGTVTGAEPLTLTASTGSVTAHDDGTWRWSYTPTDGPDDSRSVTLTVEDRAGRTAAVSFGLDVVNVAPHVQLHRPLDGDGKGALFGKSITVEEGATEGFGFTVSDPGEDGFTLEDVDCGPGTMVHDSLQLTADGGSFDCVFPDGSAEGQVIVDVIDDDGATGHAGLLTLVDNVAPTMTWSEDSPLTVSESTTAARTYAYAVLDPGDDVVETLGTTCGEAGTKVAGSDVFDGTEGSFSCVFPDGPSSSTVAVTASDGEDTGTASMTVEVANVAPSVRLERDIRKTIGDFTVSEGQPETFSFAVHDPGDDGFEVADTICDDGTVIEGSLETTSGGGSFDCAFPDGPSSEVVLVSVTDDDGATGTTKASVVVENVAPSVGDILAPEDPVAVGTMVEASATFTDPGADTHTAVWDWGDGTTSSGDIDPDTGRVTGSHVYEAAEVHTVTLTVTDDDDDAGAALFEYIVVYDPEGGFVTGNGAIDSPPGAYTPDPEASGSASFGFVSRYQRGASEPDGNTRFQFRAGDLRFTSTAYQWLVISGPKAQFKGSGTINRGGDYGFLLTATDGDAAGGGGEDQFRIRIWDHTTGEVIYDNQPGDANDAEATTALRRGSITVHSGR